MLDEMARFFDARFSGYEVHPSLILICSWDSRRTIITNGKGVE